MITFPQLQKMNLPYPDAESGDHAIQSIEVSKAEAKLNDIRCSLNGTNFMRCTPGTHRRLYRLSTRTVVMSNSLMELRTNWRFIRKAAGDVLINGLGLGIVPFALLRKAKSIRSITIIEKSNDVIELVGNHLADAAYKAGVPLAIEHDDAYSRPIPPIAKYEYVWHDIWDTISAKNLVQMAALVAKYRKHSGWQGCWSADICLLSMRRDVLRGDLTKHEYKRLISYVKRMSGSKSSKAKIIIPKGVSAYADD